MSFEHATVTGYRNHGCRCDLCRAVQAAYNRRQRRAQFASGNISHGTRTGYDVGCRCWKCSEARRVAYYTLASEYPAQRREATS